ncbi:MAG: MGMT family protein [Candidatus Parcubacteria bacterium]|nr:MGMT family protein [Candidatus Parcubacteria bacterium]
MSDIFREKVYKIVWKIPRGKTLSYKEVAKLAGRPKAYRAVGNIMAHHNIKGLPCHRVIKSDGTLGGFCGGYKEVKRKEELLKKEGAI